MEQEALSKLKSTILNIVVKILNQLRTEKLNGFYLGLGLNKMLMLESKIVQYEV